MSNNRLHNVTNRFQTPVRRVLCVCSAGLLRSPTAANVLHREYGYNTRAAGITREYALIPVDHVLCEWADELVCVDSGVADELITRFPEYLGKVTTLNVLDIYEWNAPELREAISSQYRSAHNSAAVQEAFNG